MKNEYSRREFLASTIGAIAVVAAPEVASQRQAQGPASKQPSVEILTGQEFISEIRLDCTSTSELFVLDAALSRIGKVPGFLSPAEAYAFMTNGNTGGFIDVPIGQTSEKFFRSPENITAFGQLLRTSPLQTLESQRQLELWHRTLLGTDSQNNSAIRIPNILILTDGGGARKLYNTAILREYIRQLHAANENEGPHGVRFDREVAATLAMCNRMAGISSITEGVLPNDGQTIPQ